MLHAAVVDTAKARQSLVGKDVAGELRFVGLGGVGDEYQGIFVRFSWFDTQGRMSHETQVMERGGPTSYTFTFQQKCTEDFLDFLETGSVAMQVRGFESE